MTHDPLKDRNYYRQFNDYDLLELAKSVKTTELELVLAERLRNAKNIPTTEEEKK
jgi:hypothetical protein